MLASGSSLNSELNPRSKSDHQDTIYLDWVILASHGDIFTSLCS